MPINFLYETRIYCYTIDLCIVSFLILQQFLFVCYERKMHASINPNILTIIHNQTYTISYDKSPLCVKNTYICCLLFLSAQCCKQIELLLIYSPPMNNKNNSRHRKVKVCRQQNDG